MDFILATVLAAILLLVYWLTNGKPRGMPPGPIGLPLLGYPFLGEKPYIVMMDLAKKYGPVFTLPFLNQHVVVLNDWRSIKMTLVQQSDTFSGRPPCLISEIMLKNADVIFSDGPGWRERRRFTVHHLKDFGFGQKSMEGVVMEEVTTLMEQMDKMVGQKKDFGHQLFLCFLNIIWSMVSGKRFKFGDRDMLEFVEVLDSIVEGITPSKHFHIIPVLRHLPGSGYQEFYRAFRKLDAFVIKEVDEHLATYQEGHARDFIDVFLTEIKAQQQKADNPSSARSFQRKNLNAIIFDLFLAGGETGSTTLTWGLLYMITWPEVQIKVQEELDKVIGRSRLPTWQDRSVLPYTEAVLLEIHRYASLVPLSALHYTMATSTLGSYVIPKSTTIFENIWAVHHDPKYWGDPDVFRPERFLNDEGKVQKPEYLIPFSVGGRACLGESVAKTQMFLFFTCLLHRFSFKRAPGEVPPTLEPLVRSALKPKPFSIIFEWR